MSTDTLHFSETGTGPTILLIHGFPFNQQVWKDFGEKLAESVRVVTVDLPGFGKSPLLPEGFALSDVATTLLSWMQQRNYDRPFVVGHSLGGYIALAMAEQDPTAMAGLCLFHSTAIADNEEKKASRDKVLDFVARQGVRAFTSNFVSDLYADPRHHSITRVKNIAVQASTDAVIGYTRAMRDRPDRRPVLQSFPGRVLLLAGEKDKGIPAESVVEQGKLHTGSRTVILPDVAHMGMFESENACAKELTRFATTG